jgi:hypothetical protein
MMEQVVVGSSEALHDPYEGEERTRDDSSHQESFYIRWDGLFIADAHFDLLLWNGLQRQA